MIKTNSVCDYCKALASHEIYRDKNSKYKILKCQNCKLAYLYPKPSSKEIEKFYQEGYFESGLANTGYSNYIQLTNELHLEAKKRLEIISQYITSGSLLDIGCGYGHFLKEAKDLGFDVMGFDISREAITKLKNDFGIRGKVGDVLPGQLPNSQFDIITSWDVVEHFPDPLKSFSALNNIQAKGAYFIFTTPNIESIDGKLLGKYWYGFKRIPEHLYFFSPKTVSNYLKDSGYTVVDIKNWGFYRNIGYMIDQTMRYHRLFYNVTNRLAKILNIKNKTIFFPIIDMLVVARKKYG